MKRTKTSIFGSMFLVSVWILSSCSGVRIINTDKAPDFTLSNYKTFDFLETDTTGKFNAKFDERMVLLKKEIVKQLAARGLSQTSANPDLSINIGVVIEEKIQTRETDFRTDANYLGQRNYSWQTETVEVGRYREGTVTLHFIDRAKNAMVWRGAANGIVPEKDTKVEETITTGVEELIKKVN